MIRRLLAAPVTLSLCAVPVSASQAKTTHTSKSRTHRSAAAKHAFEVQSGYPHGRPGYVVDHIVLLACGGKDAPSNMQWQTIAEAKAKDLYRAQRLQMIEHINAAIYARKSTEQTGVANEQKSVARQVEHARMYAVKKGWTVADDAIFIDDGISGAEFANRPGFLRLMNALKPRPVFYAVKAISPAFLCGNGQEGMASPRGIEPCFEPEGSTYRRTALGSATPAIVTDRSIRNERSARHRHGAKLNVQRQSRVAANGRPLRRAGDLAEARERFAEHRRGLFADRPRLGAQRSRQVVGPADAGHYRSGGCWVFFISV